MTRTDLTAELRSVGLPFDIVEAPRGKSAVSIAFGSVKTPAQKKLIRRLNKALAWPIGDVSDKGYIYNID